MSTYAERFWAKVDKSGECWLWTASKCAGGYGRLMLNGKGRKAQRVAWELERGPILHLGGNHGTYVLHRCDNRACVNPNHLFLGTHEDNMRDMAAKGRAWNPTAIYHRKQTQCKHGHEFTPENTYVHDGARHCKQCRIGSNREWRRRSAEAA